MSLELRQATKPRSSGAYWEWSVWLEGPDKELDEVSKVRYQLHPTFPEPVRNIVNRQTKFRLDSSGWGEFAVYAMVVRKDRSETRLQHWLRLEDVGESGAYLKAKPPTVFISSSVADAGMAQSLAAALKERGLKVLSADNIRAGDNFKEVTRDQIDQADIGLILISDAPGSWVAHEAMLLQETNSLVVPIVTSEQPSQLGDLARDPAALHVASEEAPDRIVDMLLRHPDLSRWNLLSSGDHQDSG